jgi:polyhydroxybutyrate depolymerase
MDDPRQALRYDARVNHLRRTGLALSVSILAFACSGAEDDSSAPGFTGVGAPGSGSPSTTAPAAPPSGTPPTASPTPPGAEQPPVTGGIDTSGTATPGMVGGEPTPNTPANPPTEPGPQPPNAAGAASAGCGLSQGIPQNVAVDSTIVTFPPTYDGSTPVPLVFGFHGAGRTNEEQQTVDSRTIGSDLERNYIMAYVKSAGNAWDLGTDYPRFQAIRTQILSQFCVDTEHVFAFGHSSGAQFIVQMLGDNRARETGFAAVAPVSSSRYSNPEWTPVPTLLIHGLNDTSRPGDNDGAQDIAQYAESNQCAGGTTELAVPTCTSLAQGATVNPGCVQYNGCAAPTLFCNHNDPNYLDNGNPTNHGWPCFANSEIFAFFEAQR